MVRRADRSEESRTEVVTVRLTKAERTRLEFRAAAAGLTVSAFSSRLLNGGKVTVEAKPAGMAVSPELLAEFKRIGNNLNQIAHALNSRKAIAEHAVAHQFVDFVKALLTHPALGAIARPLAERIAPPRRT